MVQGMVGADAQALDDLARQLGEAARALDSLTGRLSAQVSHAPWHGAHADRFRSDWSRSYRRELVSAVAFLRDGERTLHRNAADQRAASGEAGGTAWSGGLFGVGGAVAGSSRAGGSFVDGVATAGLGVASAAFLTRLNSRLDPWSKYLLDPAGKTVDVLQRLSDSKMVSGRYSNAWHEVMKVGSSHGIPQEFLKFKQSPVTHFLHPANHAFGLIGTGLSAVSLGIGTVTAAADFGQHHYMSAGLDAASVAAGAIKGHGGVTGYVAGVALQTWVQVGRAAQTVDWSAQGMHELQQASLSDWGSALGSAVKQMPGQLWTIFA